MNKLLYLRVSCPKLENMIPRLLLPVLLVGSLASGCINIKTHSTIDPIYMTLDVNLKVELQKELADVFGDIDAASVTIQK